MQLTKLINPLQRYQVPINSLLGKDKFKKLLKNIDKILKKKGLKTSQLSPYIIEITMENGEKRTLGLQNLERKLADIPVDEWTDEISKFFEILTSSVNYEKLAHEDLDTFLNSLRIKFHPVDDVQQFWDNSVYREYVPSLRGVVSFDATKYVFSVSKSIFNELKISPAQAIKRALKNTFSNSKISDEFTPQNNERIRIYAGDDYTATHIIPLRKDWKELRFGKLYAIPSKHIIVTLDITDSIVEDLNQYIGLVLNMHSEEIGPISNNLFWSWQGKQYELEVSMDQGRVVFTPHELFMDEVMNTIGNMSYFID